MALVDWGPEVADAMIAADKRGGGGSGGFIFWFYKNKKNSNRWSILFDEFNQLGEKKKAWYSKEVEKSNWVQYCFAYCYNITGELALSLFLFSSA